MVAGLDEVGGAFGDHDSRRVGVASGDPGHHRGVYDTQPVHTADPELTVHHRSVVIPHAAGADRMECRLGVFSNEGRQRRIIDLAGPRSHRPVDVRAQGCGWRSPTEWWALR